LIGRIVTGSQEKTDGFSDLLKSTIRVSPADKLRANPPSPADSLEAHPPAKRPMGETGNLDKIRIILKLCPSCRR
jgi:hypothetical protein